MSEKTTTLTNLGERELLVLLDGVDHLVADLESDMEADQLDGSRYDWADIARMRERIQSARRRVRA
jgi:hypothetical protein